MINNITREQFLEYIDKYPELKEIHDLKNQCIIEQRFRDAVEYVKQERELLLKIQNQEVNDNTE